MKVYVEGGMVAYCTDSEARMKVVFGKIEVQNLLEILGLH